jgi:CHAT domain-containing protein
LAYALFLKTRGKAENLEQAIAINQSVLEVWSKEAFPYGWALTHQNLASAYGSRLHGRKSENLDRAIEFCLCAMDAFTREAFPIEWATLKHNLASALLRRGDGGETAALEQALVVTDEALTIRTALAFPREHLETSHLRGQLLARLRRWPEASNTFAEARDTFLLLVGEGFDEAETSGLVETAGSLFAEAAFVAAELNEPEKAFVIACEGKARLLSTTLRLQNLDLPPEESLRVGTLRAAIRQQSRSLQSADGLERTRRLDQLAALRTELASLASMGDARTKRQPKLAQARAFCADGSVIALPVVTPAGGKLFLIMPVPESEPTLVIVDLPELTARRMNRLLKGTESGDATEPSGWLACFSRDVPAPERRKRLISSVDDLGEKLWSLLAGPLEKALAGHGVAADARLIFLPSAGFGLLPLGLAEEPGAGLRLLDKREIAYAPSLDALDRAAAADQRASLAAIINPTGDLIHAPAEAALVAAQFDDLSILDGKDATLANVLTSLQDKSHWHFCTHGTFDLDDARRSALSLKSGETLTVSDLIDAEGLGFPRLVVLSACETGLHEYERTPDEFIGFPGALISIGAHAVLGTLWPVNDAAATFLTGRFYELHRSQGLAPAAALRKAQLWLRSATRAELAALAEAAPSDLQSGFEADALRRLEAAVEDTAEQVRFLAPSQATSPTGRPPPGAARIDGEPFRPFAHPIYWGGYVVTGC